MVDQVQRLYRHRDINREYTIRRTDMQNTRRYEGFVKDQHGNSFRVTCEARDWYEAKRILESQHAPSPVNFIREIH